MKNSERIFSRQGYVFKTDQGYTATITEYKNSRDCSVLFSDGTLLNNIQYNRVKPSLRNPNHITLCGIGFLGADGEMRGEVLKIYRCWSRMIMRCYNPHYQEKEPSYIGGVVCEEWHNFQNFLKWHYKNFKKDTMQHWHLDKDILVKGNKVYSPENCAFVPVQINSILTKRKALRGKYLIGVSLSRNGKFRAYINRGGTQNRFLGQFDTELEAFQAYKTAKEEYIKEVADKWKDLIDPRVYEALYNYTVEITD